MTYFSFFKKLISLFSEIQFLGGGDALYENCSKIDCIFPEIFCSQSFSGLKSVFAELYI